MTPRGYCRGITRRAGSSFFYPLLFLPAAKRRAMYAIYAFCRLVDDVVDGGTPSATPPRERLEWWRRELSVGFGGGGSTDPVVSELVRAEREFRLPREPFFQIIAGMELDLERNRYATLAELEWYCQHVAVAVGVLALRVFLAVPANGEPVPATGEGEEFSPDQFAHHLGLAFQLTNILRDVTEDAAWGRVYLPQELLERHGVTVGQVLAREFTPGLGLVLAELAQEATTRYRLAERLAPTRGRTRWRILPALLMAAIYREYLERLRATGFNRLQSRPRMGLSTKLRLTLRTLGRELFPGRSE